MRQAGRVTVHAERLFAPLSWWLAVAAFAATCGWIVLVISSVPTAVITALVAAALMGTVVGRYGSMRVSADERGLQVGPALLRPEFVGTAEPLHRAEYRARLGVDADARAHLVTRPYLDRGVLVTVDDPADPTPYWLISSRHPDELAAAINRSTLEGTPRDQEV